MANSKHLGKFIRTEQTEEAPAFSICGCFGQHWIWKIGLLQQQEVYVAEVYL